MRIGIDVGGSHIGLGLIDKDGKIILKKEEDICLKSNINTAKEIIVNNIVKFTKEILEEKGMNISDLELIGIAFPGTISGKVVIKAENLGIENFNIVDDINKQINIPIYLRNDAKCAALAEKEYGVLKEYEDSIFLVVGTGVGGAVFLGNKLLVPKKYEGFEIGHMAISKEGIRCNCGRTGCFETYTSMKRLKAKIKSKLKLKEIDGKELKELILQDKNMKKIDNIIEEYSENLAIGIANLINIFEPEVVCIRWKFCTL